MKTDNIVKRLIDLKQTNPDLVTLIEDNFPETIDVKPYVKHGALFVRKDYANGLYTLVYDGHAFRIHNVRENREWVHTVKASHESGPGTVTAYLTKYDFQQLVKRSGVRFSTIVLVTDKAFRSMFNLTVYPSL